MKNTHLQLPAHLHLIVPSPFLNPSLPPASVCCFGGFSDGLVRGLSGTIDAIQAGDALFRKMMEVTLTEDKEIIENIYPEYQKGFMNARYDRQVKAAHRSFESAFFHTRAYAQQSVLCFMTRHDGGGL